MYPLYSTSYHRCIMHDIRYVSPVCASRPTSETGLCYVVYKEVAGQFCFGPSFQNLLADVHLLDKDYRILCATNPFRHRMFRTTLRFEHISDA